MLEQKSIKVQDSSKLNEKGMVIINTYIHAHTNNILILIKCMILLYKIYNFFLNVTFFLHLEFYYNNFLTYKCILNFIFILLC